MHHASRAAGLVETQPQTSCLLQFLTLCSLFVFLLTTFVLTLRSKPPLTTCQIQKNQMASRSNFHQRCKQNFKHIKTLHFGKRKVCSDCFFNPVGFINQISNQMKLTSRIIGTAWSKTAMKVTLQSKYSSSGKTNKCKG